jgi:hypothetical protein
MEAAQAYADPCADQAAAEGTAAKLSPSSLAYRRQRTKLFDAFLASVHVVRDSFPGASRGAMTTELPRVLNSLQDVRRSIDEVYRAFNDMEVFLHNAVQEIVDEDENLEVS